jgi:hypothetical protein
VRRFKIAILVAVCTLLVPLLYTILLLQGKIAISKWTPKGLSIMAQATAPPADLDELLVSVPLDIAAKGSTAEAHFTNKYAGRYDVGVLLSGYNSYWMDKPRHGLASLKLKLHVEFFSRQSLLLVRGVDADAGPFCSPHTGNGLWLSSYECPDDLPLDEEITCHVTVVEPDRELSVRFGSAIFFMQKSVGK